MLRFVVSLLMVAEGLLVVDGNGSNEPQRIEIFSASMWDTQIAPGLTNFALGYNMLSGLPANEDNMEAFMDLTILTDEKGQPKTLEGSTWYLIEEVIQPQLVPECIFGSVKSHFFHSSGIESLEQQATTTSIGYERAWEVEAGVEVDGMSAGMSEEKRMTMMFGNSKATKNAQGKRQEQMTYQLQVEQRTSLYNSEVKLDSDISNAKFKQDFLDQLRGIEAASKLVNPEFGGKSSETHRLVYNFIATYGTHMLTKAKFGTYCVSNTFMRSDSTQDERTTARNNAKSVTVDIQNFKAHKKSENLTDGAETAVGKSIKVEQNLYCKGLQALSNCPQNQGEFGTTNTQDNQPAMTEYSVRPYWGRAGLRDGFFSRFDISKQHIAKAFNGFVAEFEKEMSRCGELIESCDREPLINLGSCKAFCAPASDAFTEGYTRFPDDFTLMIKHHGKFGEESTMSRSNRHCLSNMWFPRGCDSCTLAKIEMNLTTDAGRSRWDLGTVGTCPTSSGDACYDAALGNLSPPKPKCYFKKPASQSIQTVINTINMSSGSTTTLSALGWESNGEKKCPEGQLLVGLKDSEYYNWYEDRKHRFTCRTTPGSYTPVGGRSKWVSHSNTRWVDIFVWNKTSRWDSCSTCFFYGYYSKHGQHIPSASGKSNSDDRYYKFKETWSDYWTKGSCLDWQYTIPSDWRYKYTGNYMCPNGYAVSSIISLYSYRWTDRMIAGLKCCKVVLTAAGRLQIQTENVNTGYLNALEAEDEEIVLGGVDLGDDDEDVDDEAAPEYSGETDPIEFDSESIEAIVKDEEEDCQHDTACSCQYVGIQTELDTQFLCQSSNGQVCYNLVADWCAEDERICEVPAS